MKTKNRILVLVSAAQAGLLVAGCGEPPIPDVKVAGVTLDNTHLSLSVGDSQILTARITPADATNEAVIWRSSEPAIVSVDDDGRVTALGDGTATVTVATEDGGKTASCSVAVGIDLLKASYIPDPVFLAFCQRQMGSWDGNDDGCLSPDEAAAVTSMNVGNVNQDAIYSMKGIEWFTGLKNLKCYSNYLTGLDVSNCRLLTSLDCGGCALTMLDISGCTALTEIRCPDNDLSELDISGCSKLAILDVDGNDLSALDVSKNSRLTQLKCDRNRLTSLNVAECRSLELLTAKNNKLTLLDLSKNISLRELTCSDNRLSVLYVSKCVELELLDCYSNELASLDISNCRRLLHLDCYNNALTGLDLSKNALLMELTCSANQLRELDLDGNPLLERLACNSNSIARLDLGNCTALSNLICDENSLAELDLSANASLRELVCNGNSITRIDIDGAGTFLEHIYCSDNSLEAGGINALFEDLPQSNPEIRGTIHIGGNPGAASCDVNIALAKNWMVTTY